MRTILKDSSIFSVPKNPHMLHLATLQRGLREFWVMLCVSGPHKHKCYIEELVANTVSFSEDIFGNFKFIEDDDLARELAEFVDRHKLTDIPSRMNELAETGMIHKVMN